MRSILVIEDHPDTRKVLVNLLSRWGYEVRDAGTAAEGFQAAREIKFDVILCDIGLPDETGWELMRRIRSVNENVRAIALTAFNTAQDREESRRAGFDFHFSKPADMADVREALAA
jgi:CheY-like chemotaxis protein